MSNRKWLTLFLSLAIGLLVLMAGTVYVLDPYFHYHKPLTGVMYYELNNERSQNDGIIRNFDYDAMFTGTSMTENTPVSRVDDRFGCTCIKIPSSGAPFTEIDGYVRSAAARNPDLKLVFRCLDTDYFLSTQQAMFYAKGDYPEYLYNDNPFDDVNYLINQEVFLVRCIQPLLGGLLRGTRGITEFDRFGRWEDSYPNGRAHLLAGAQPFTPPETVAVLTEEEAFLVRQNLITHARKTAEENPDITFYYFLPPYSILWWGNQWQAGRVQKSIDIQKAAIEALVDCENIRLFSFNTDLSIVENLDNYRDHSHYLTCVLERIIDCMAQDEYRLTPENYADHIALLEDIYLRYDYNSIFSS